MTSLTNTPHTVSVSEAHARGVAGLVRAAELGENIVVERHGRAVAAVVAMGHLEQLKRLETDLLDSVVLLSRLATDSGNRTDLDRAIVGLGFDRVELEAELDADLASGRE